MTPITSIDTIVTLDDSGGSGTADIADVIDAATARRLIDTDASIRVIDVRTGGEFAAAHIPGAFNIPLDTLSEHLDVLADVEHPVVLVCASGARASTAHSRLSTAGKQRVHILDGGMNAWQDAGGDVARIASTTWAMDRQVRLVAGSLVLSALVASTVAPRAKWLAAGVAGGLTYSALSNTCALATVLSKLPYNRADDCDIDRVLGELRGEV